MMIERGFLSWAPRQVPAFLLHLTFLDHTLEVTNHWARSARKMKIYKCYKINMLILFVLFFIFVIHVKVLALQRKIEKLEVLVDASKDVEEIALYRRLKFTEKHELFACVSSSINLFENEGFVSPFESFWRACHELDAGKGEKFFEEALFLMKQNSKDQVKVLMHHLLSRPTLVQHKEPVQSLAPAAPFAPVAPVAPVEPPEEEDEEEDLSVDKKHKKVKSYKNKHVE